MAADRFGDGANDSAGESFEISFDKLDDLALIRAMTRDRSNYNESFPAAAKAELKKRGLELAAITDQVSLAFNDGPRISLSIDEALEKLQADITLWDIWWLENCLAEQFAIYRTSVYWGIYYMEADALHFSFILDTEGSQFETVVRQFLRLEDWETSLDQTLDLAEWELLHRSGSDDYMNTIAMALDKERVPFTLKHSHHQRFNAIFGTYYPDEVNYIFVPADNLDDARAVMKTVEASIQGLYAAVEAAAEKGDSDAELAAYESLSRLMPEDKIAFFNKGVILFGKKRFEEAVEAFIEAELSGDNDIVEETHFYLQKIAEKVPDNVYVWQSLADIAMKKGDFLAAEEYFNKVIKLDSSAGMAHLNLAYLFYESEYRTEEALRHFKKYLELQPQADDRQLIETIISELGG